MTVFTDSGVAKLHAAHHLFKNTCYCCIV